MTQSPSYLNFSGSHALDLDRNQVWSGLKDPAILQQSIKGCEQVIKHNETEYEARFCVKVGPVKRRFQSSLTIIDVKIPEQYNLDCHMNAGMFGDFQGHAEVSLHSRLRRKKPPQTSMMVYIK